MNQERKALLVAALRSGKYKQTHSVLERTLEGDVSNCCLGVGCRVFLEHNPNDLPVFVYDNNLGHTITSFGGIRTYLPDVVQDWFGFPLKSGAMVTIHGKAISLACHNDQGATFDEIAHAIEEQL